MKNYFVISSAVTVLFFYHVTLC